MNTKPFTIENYFNALTELTTKIDFSEVQAGIDIIRNKFESGKQIITCGNGGSAATASHYINDWNKTVSIVTGKKFKGVSLCDNIGLITSYANDLSYEEVFSGQLKSILDEGDLVIAISGSGNSSNVLNAVEYANSIGADTLAVVGYDGGKLKPIAKYSVWVPSFDMQLSEDVHFIFGHLVMKALCSLSIK